MRSQRLTVALFHRPLLQAWTPVPLMRSQRLTATPFHRALLQAWKPVPRYRLIHQLVLAF
jgi:hypothetical protein